jgi:hypothetical protein
MPLFGGGKPKTKKLRGKKGLKDAFDIPLHTTVRDRAAMAKEAAQEAAVRTLAREKKKEADRQAAVDKAEALKTAALARREARERETRRKRDARKRQQEEALEQRTACTCRRPTLDKNGKCTRCHKTPATRRR